MAYIQMHSDRHGMFEADGEHLQALVESYFGSVNQSRSVLQKAIEKALGEGDYSDLNEIELLFVARELGWYSDTITQILAGD